MSDELRTDIFNGIVVSILVLGTNYKENKKNSIIESFFDSYYQAFWNKFFNSFYINILKQPVTRKKNGSSGWAEFENYFFSQKWYGVYSLLEWFVSLFKEEEQQAISDLLNKVLENNCSGYRVVNGLVTPITNKNEIIEIETALEHDKGIAVHLSAALRFLSDKNTKDYRNSIKESISAVEKLVREFTGKSTLGDGLKVLKSNGIIIPETLQTGFQKIYGWTCGEDGIRHAIMEGAQEITIAEAKFMLVACSAFINYLKMKDKDIA